MANAITSSATQHTALQNEEAAAKHGFFSIESLGGGGPCWSCDSCVFYKPLFFVFAYSFSVRSRRSDRDTHTPRPREIDTERVSECKEISNGRHV